MIAPPYYQLDDAALLAHFAAAHARALLFMPTSSRRLRRNSPSVIERLLDAADNLSRMKVSDALLKACSRTCSMT